MLSNGACAVRYAHMGLGVLPCSMMTKAPLTENGFYDATTDVEEVRKIWTKMPNASVGLRIPDDIVVLDVDDIRILEYIEEIPETVTSITPRDNTGRHFWFKKPEGMELRRHVNLTEGVDLLTHLGYIIVPNSQHASGKRYEWDTPPVSAVPHWGAAELPEWVVSWVHDKQGQPAGSQNDDHSPKISISDTLHHLQSGNRHQGLFRYACSLRGRGVHESEAISLVHTAAMNADPPYLDKKAEDIVGWVYRKYSPNIDKDEDYKIYSVGNMLATDFGETTFFVERILPEGFILFTSDPKMGKSMIAANIALSIARGELALGKLETIRSGVLYIDLEQGEKGSQSRWRNIVGSDSRVPDNLYTALKWDRMGEGGLERLEKFLDAHPDVRVVIIDVLALFRPAEEKRSGTQYDKDYAVINPLSELAKGRDISIIGVHHNKKNADSGDFIKNASGSMAMAGASDAVWGLKRARNSSNAILEVTGKNIAECKLRMQSYGSGFRWFTF